MGEGPWFLFVCLQYSSLELKLRENNRKSFLSFFFHSKCFVSARPQQMGNTYNQQSSVPPSGPPVPTPAPAPQTYQMAPVQPALVEEPVRSVT